MLKKIFLVVNLTIIIFVLKINQANAYTGNGFIWNKTEIEIPVNSNFLDYLDEFEVTFYYQGDITDSEVKVQVDDFYYGDLTISTKSIGTKTVKLIATVSGYSSFDRKDITVHIVDKVPPTISLLQALIFPIGNPVNYQDYFLCQDNFEVLSIIFNDTKINYTVLGIYELVVIVSDKGGNVVEQKFNVSIVDKQKPTINTASFIEVEYGDLNFDITSYVEALDDLDGDISNNVKIEGLDIYKLGEQIVEIRVSDSSGNVTALSKTITVVDHEAPTLELKTYYDTILITDNNIDLTSYILKVDDNCTSLINSNVEIDASDFSMTYGSHKVIYKVKDESLNYSTRILTLNVSYASSPIIIASDLTFKQNEIFDLKSYITVKDDYDQDVSNNYIIYDDILDKSTPGKYEIVIEATNKAGLTTQKIIYVTIEPEKTEANTNIDSIKQYIYQNKTKLAILVIVGTIAIIYLKNKKKQNNQI